MYLFDGIEAVEKPKCWWSAFMSDFWEYLASYYGQQFGAWDIYTKPYHFNAPHFDVVWSSKNLNTYELKPLLEFIHIDWSGRGMPEPSKFLNTQEVLCSEFIRELEGEHEITGIFYNNKNDKQATELFKTSNADPISNGLKYKFRARYTDGKLLILEVESINTKAYLQRLITHTKKTNAMREALI